MMLFLNLLALGSQGKVEAYVESQGDELNIKCSLHYVTAKLETRNHDDKSILTTYTEDDKATWKDFRGELIQESFSGRM